MKDIRNLEFFAKGKRGFIHTGFIGKTKVAVKSKNPRSEAEGRMRNEGRMMETLNKHGIGPRLIEHDDDRVVYEFVEGELILDFLEKEKGNSIFRVLLGVLDQCRKMDELGIVKEEMIRPIKHILVTKKGPVMIDFERARHTNKPHNVTQFVQFLTNSSLTPRLREKGVFISIPRIRELAALYKRNQSEKNYQRIRSTINLRSEFEAKVLLAVAKVPKGRVATYGDIARLIGCDAVRAVGRAISKNPCVPEIPCHRIVRSDGTTGEYSGEEFVKAELLKKEGIKLSGEKILDFDKVRIS